MCVCTELYEHNVKCGEVHTGLLTLFTYDGMGVQGETILKDLQ